MTLPQVVRPDNKVFVGVTAFIVCAVTYLTSNHFLINIPTLLPMTSLDLAIPFIPQSVWVYITEYLFFLMICITAKDILNLNRYLYSFAFQQSTAIFIFILWPTIYPRERFPLLFRCFPL
jgi:hypothetical protein